MFIPNSSNHILRLGTVQVPLSIVRSTCQARFLEWCSLRIRKKPLVMRLTSVHVTLQRTTTALDNQRNQESTDN
jgi:hypothetical protein